MSPSLSLFLACLCHHTKSPKPQQLPRGSREPLWAVLALHYASFQLPVPASSQHGTTRRRSHVPRYLPSVQRLVIGGKRRNAHHRRDRAMHVADPVGGRGGPRVLSHSAPHLQRCASLYDAERLCHGVCWSCPQEKRAKHHAKELTRCLWGFARFLHHWLCLCFR